MAVHHDRFQNLMAHCLLSVSLAMAHSSIVLAGPVHDAAKAGNLKALQMLVAQTSDPGKAINEQDEMGYSALHWVVIEGKIELVPWLLKSGADVKLRAKGYESPLQLAGKHGRPQTARYLIEAGAGREGGLEDTDGRLSTPVTMAAENGHPEVLKVLLENGANVDGVAPQCSPATYCAPEDVLPLNYAVRYEHREVIKVLVEHKSSTSKTFSFASTQNMRAFLYEQGLRPDDKDVMSFAQLGDVALFKEILKYSDAATCLAALKNIGISHNEYSEVPSLTRPLPGMEILQLLLERAPEAYKEAPTLLHVSMAMNEMDVAKMLLAKGFDVNRRDPFGNTPLHWAISAGRIRMRDPEKDQSTHSLAKIRFLLDNGADINARNEWGNTPLHRAVPEGELMVVKLLVERGANVNAANELGVTALHMTALRGYLGIARALLEKKANANAQTTRGTQPLHAAASVAQPEMVQLLLDSGANVNGQTNHKMSPLHYALAGGYLFHISRDNYGVPIAMFAAHGELDPWHLEQDIPKRLSTIQLLLSKGARVNAQNEWSVTPLHMAITGYKSLPIQMQNSFHRNDSTEYVGALEAMPGRIAAVKLLLEAGANPHSSAPGNSTPLEAARNLNNKDPVLIGLLENARKGEGQGKAESQSQSRPVPTPQRNY